MHDPATASRRQQRQTRRRSRAIAVLATALLACMSAFSGIAGQPSTEYRIKAAFLYNFTSFVTWPEASAGQTGFTLCVFGKDPFGKLLDRLAGKPVKNTKLVVRRLESLALLDQCQLVFISEISTDQLGATLALLHRLPVLTVSDMHGFTGLGGIIEFRIIDNKVRFDINLDAAESAGLTISSKLLSLATRFRQND
jgi:hypothetical protein